MKNYLLGVLTMFFLSFSLQLIWFSGLNYDNDTWIDIGYYGGEAIRGVYFVKPLTNRCSTKKRCKRESCATNAEYFDCGKFQIIINDLIYGDANE